MYSLPSPGRCIQHLGCAIRVRQQNALQFGHHSPRRRSDGSGSDGCDGASVCIPSGSTSGHCLGVYGRYQGCFCSCSWNGRYRIPAELYLSLEKASWRPCRRSYGSWVDHIDYHIVGTMVCLKIVFGIQLHGRCIESCMDRLMTVIHYKREGRKLD